MFRNSNTNGFFHNDHNNQRPPASKTIHSESDKTDCIEASFSDIYNCKIGWNILQYASIVFDNERIQRFELNENLECSGKAINGDIWMLNCSYEVIEKTTNSFIVEYRITQEDYENAEIL